MINAETWSQCVRSQRFFLHDVHSSYRFNRCFHNFARPFSQFCWNHGSMGVFLSSIYAYSCTSFILRMQMQLQLANCFAPALCCKVPLMTKKTGRTIFFGLASFFLSRPIFFGLTPKGTTFDGAGIYNYMYICDKLHIILFTCLSSYN